MLTSSWTLSGKAELREQVKKETQDAVEEIRKLKDKSEEAYAKSELDTLLPIKHGQVDHRFLAILRNIWAYNKSDGSVNFRASLAERHKYLDEFYWRIDHGLPTTPEGA